MERKWSNILSFDGIIEYFWRSERRNPRWRELGEAAEAIPAMFMNRKALKPPTGHSPCFKLNSVFPRFKTNFVILRRVF